MLYSHQRPSSRSPPRRHGAATSATTTGPGLFARANERGWGAHDAPHHHPQQDAHGTFSGPAPAPAPARLRLQHAAASSATVPPPCRSPNRLAQYIHDQQRDPAADPRAPAPMPLFHDALSPRRRYDGSLTLGPVTVNAQSYLRRSMEKLPVQCGPAGDVPPGAMWTNPAVRSPPPTLADASRGVGDPRWWRSHVSFSLPYSPEVADYDPNWINSAVQRVVSDRGVTVHKLPSYAPQYWDPASAASLGQPTTLGAARSWSLEERAARSVGAVRAPVGVALRCSHFLGDGAHVHPRASLAGKCVSGETVAALLSLARPRTLSRGSERGASGLSLAKHSFAFEQSSTATYPGMYPAIGVR